MSSDLTQLELGDIKKQLSHIERYGQGEYIAWLRSAFFTHESQIKHLRHDMDELRALFMKRLHISPISVREAQLLKVCRICLREDKCVTGESLVLNYGEEYAHSECLRGAK